MISKHPAMTEFEMIWKESLDGLFPKWVGSLMLVLMDEEKD